MNQRDVNRYYFCSAGLECISPAKDSFYKRYLKRPFDIMLTLLAMIALAPFLLVVALLVRARLGRPIIFKQERLGFKEKAFIIYKFRTMTDERDDNNELLPDKKRLTKFGEFLRSTSIDELPEFINILKGDMSIVGPRPFGVAYQPYYLPEERLRHTVRPGLTGLAQVCGRNVLQWEERFRYDVKYVKNVTFLVDAAIILRTIKKAFMRSEIGLRGVDAPMDFDVYRQLQK